VGHDPQPKKSFDFFAEIQNSKIGGVMPNELGESYLATVRERYQKGSKQERSLILKEFCSVSGYERKYAAKFIKKRQQEKKKKPGPKTTYNDQVVHHLKYLWERMNHMCSKKLVAAIPLWMPFYKDVDSETKKLLLQISPATVDRLLKPLRSRFATRGVSATIPSMLRHKIPIKLLDHSVDEPGFVETDTVAHCGDNIAGSYAHSLTVTDLFSGWTENRASFTKAAEAVLEQMKDIEKSFPFDLLGVACDNGSEFLNDLMLTYMKPKDGRQIDFVRRRPYKKNDQAHVEQKNFTHVRELFGYGRFDHRELHLLMNEIYKAYWNPLWNYFTPVMKLKKKERIGSKIKKEYDDPKTPFQRLLESAKVPPATKRKLIENYNLKNPFYLQEELERKLKIFFKIAEMNVDNSKKTGS
jgi:hypothetical protein